MSVLYRRPQCFRGVLARQVRACADHRIGASANPPMAVMTIYNDAWPAARFYFDFDKAPRGNYSPRMRWSRACNHVRSFCQGVADSGESAPSVAAAGFNN
jgi:hypothetical protein